MAVTISIQFSFNSLNFLCVQVGHDAGAVSAGIHMLSPYSRNLFRGVVAMSGSEVSYHSTIGKPALGFFMKCFSEHKI